MYFSFGENPTVLIFYIYNFTKSKIADTILLIYREKGHSHIYLRCTACVNCMCQLFLYIWFNPIHDSIP